VCRSIVYNYVIVLTTYIFRIIIFRWWLLDWFNRNISLQLLFQFKLKLANNRTFTINFIVNVAIIIDIEVAEIQINDFIDFLCSKLFIVLINFKNRKLLKWGCSESSSLVFKSQRKFRHYFLVFLELLEEVVVDAAYLFECLV